MFARVLAEIKTIVLSMTLKGSNFIFKRRIITMLDQRAKKLFVDYISYAINWYDNGIYTDDPDVVSALKDVMRQATDGSLDWAFDTNNLYEDDEHPEYKDYENRLPLFQETIKHLRETKSTHRKSYKRDVKLIKTEEDLKSYISDYNSIQNHLGQRIYGYELASEFHESLFYGRYYDHYYD